MNWIEADGIVLRSELSGGGPALILIHELGGSLDSFDAVVPSLAERFRVLRYDQRGAGLSEKPRQPFSLGDHITDLRALPTAHDLAPPYHLAGIAAGAAIAVSYYLAYPDEVATLSLCCPALAVAMDRRDYLAGRSKLAGEAGMRAIATTTLDRSYPPHLRGDGATYAAYRARFLGNDPVTYGHANMALVDAAIDHRLGEIAVPCLVLAGRYDLLRPPEPVEAVARRIPGGEFAIVESGHLMSVQAPYAMSMAVGDFITRRGGTRSAARDAAA